MIGRRRRPPEDVIRTWILGHCVLVTREGNQWCAQLEPSDAIPDEYLQERHVRSTAQDAILSLAADLVPLAQGGEIPVLIRLTGDLERMITS